MYKCTECECDWECTDEEADDIALQQLANNDNSEIICPKCGSETDWYDGTEEGIIW